MFIGNVEIQNPVVLAPMAGVTDLPFRLLCKEMDCGLLYTEMVSAKAILYGNKNTEALMQVTPNEHPIALQLFGSDPEVMGEIAKQWKHSEPLREELMIYLTQGCKLSYVEALHYYKRLKSDSSIFVEFTSTVRNAEYPPMGMITIEGYTAKKIAEEKNLSVLQAYDALLALKEHPKAGIGEAVKEAETITTEGEAQTAAEEEKTEEKKSFFGKLFKK